MPLVKDGTAIILHYVSSAPEGKTYSDHKCADPKFLKQVPALQGNREIKPAGHATGRDRGEVEVEGFISS